MSDLSAKFWEHTKNNMRIASLEDAFIDWANSNNLGLNVVREIWDTVNSEIKQAFSPSGSISPGSNPGITSGNESVNPANQNVSGTPNTALENESGENPDFILKDLLEEEVLEKKEEI